MTQLPLLHDICEFFDCACILLNESPCEQDTRHDIIFKVGQRASVWGCSNQQVIKRTIPWPSRLYLPYAAAAVSSDFPFAVPSDSPFAVPFAPAAAPAAAAAVPSDFPSAVPSVVPSAVPSAAAAVPYSPPAVVCNLKFNYNNSLKVNFLREAEGECSRHVFEDSSVSLQVTAENPHELSSAIPSPVPQIIVVSRI